MTTGEIGILIGIATGLLTIIGAIWKQFAKLTVLETKFCNHIDNMHRRMDSVDRKFEDFKTNHLAHLQKELDELFQLNRQQLAECSQHRERTRALEAMFDSDRHKL